MATKRQTKYPPGLYLLDHYEGESITGFEIITVNTNGVVEISKDEQPFTIEDRHTLTPLTLAGPDAVTDPLPWVSETGYRTAVQAWHPTHGLSTYSPRVGGTE